MYEVIYEGNFLSDIRKSSLNSTPDLHLGFNSKNETTSGALAQIVNFGLILFIDEGPQEPESPPSVPTISSPTENSFVESTAKFVWNEPTIGSQGVTYELQVDDNISFTSSIFSESDINTTSKVVNSLIRNKTYYWRVKAYNSVGVSNWSNVRKVRVRPKKPTLSGGFVGMGHSKAPSLSWDSINSADKYELIRRSTAFSVSNKTFDFSPSTTSYVDGLPFGVRYGSDVIYTIRVINSKGWPSIESIGAGYSKSSNGVGIL